MLDESKYSFYPDEPEWSFDTVTTDESDLTGAIVVFPDGDDAGCPVRGCEDFESYSRDALHDHLTDAHPELWETIMTGEVVIHE